MQPFDGDISLIRIGSTAIYLRPYKYTNTKTVMRMQ